MLVASAAMAQRVEGDRAVASGAYAAEVPVNNQTPGQRSNGFARALLKVITNLTGDRNPIARPGVGPALRGASTYVDGYDYRQDEGTSPNGTPTFTTTLVVRFDPKKVNDLVSGSGFAVWPTPRPKPVLWMAIDDGSGPRLVGLAQSSAARPVLDHAKERGYRLGLPTGTAAEQAMAGAIWRSDVAAISRASATYSPPMQLVGKLYRAGVGWKADWIFVDSGRVLARSSTANADARRAMAGGADIAADALIRKYARPGKPVAPATPPASKLGDTTITLVGLNGTSDYLRAINYLDDRAGVRRVVPVSATPERLVLQVTVEGGGDALAKSLADGGVLVPEAGTDGTWRLK